MLLNSLEDTKNFAKQVASDLKKGDIITLRGDLGAGKTATAKFIIEHLTDCNINEITSPTFNLVNIYESKLGKIWHFDLYRLEREEELFELAIEDAINDICIIEWPEIAQSFLSKSGQKIIDIKLSYANHEGVREAEICK